MYPAKFDYMRANSITEAVSLLQQNPEAKIIAGGHSLLPLMKLRLATPPALIDIARIADLKGVRQEGNGVTVGALTTHNEIAASDVVQRLVPALAE
ncbi:MAG: FAD binding domain-containing protein, partial [Anaerolineae bacterium]|nr:FAD binding domain-containing protein [Anaerolineae bacterium]